MTDDHPQREFRLGQGKISGVLSAWLGALGFGAVLCLLYPSLMTTPDMRAIYPMGLVRALIQLVLAVAFGLGILSVVLSSHRTLGLSGILFSLTATLLGGSEVVVEAPIPESNYIGLDWFIFNLFFLALIFVPMERLFARIRGQKVFRIEWRTDLAHFFLSHILVQATVLLTMIPAALFFRQSVSAEFQASVAAQPLALQLVEALVLADLFAYFSHRLFHSVPLLWRFHQIHHSSQILDWLASSRLHLVDIVVTRAVAFIPLYIMGFSTTALYPYLVFASIQGIFIHANLRFRFGALRHLLVTPQFHHWHHTADPQAIDKNFAIHLPVLDYLFGTYYLPKDRWPQTYGIEGNPVPRGYFRHLLYPFARSG
ncbi:MAG: sterol desaturase family protein [Myxococcales bacterium]|nr:sterol desaturase family protein [Myxococcales bacterium]